MTNLRPNRAIINPKFEGYKLDALDQDKIVLHHHLPFTPTQTTVSGRAPLSFQEVQSRITHNHLTLSPPIPGHSTRAVYIDAEWKVIELELDQATLVPSFQVLYELPRPIQSVDVDRDSPQPEYPSAAFLDSSTLIVSDGRGSLYNLFIPSGLGPASLISMSSLEISPEYGSGKSTVPFRIHSVAHVSPDTTVVILSSKHYPLDKSSMSTSVTPQSTRFDIWAVRLARPLVESQSPTTLDILWHRCGTDVPVYTYYDRLSKRFLLLGTSPYTPISSLPSVSHSPTADELVPIPRAGEDLDGISLPKPLPYSWTQTSDSVTVAFPLPANTPTSAIQVTFSPRTLSVLINGLGGAETTSGVDLPRYAAQELWAGIQPATSVWTWDREADSAFGLLTVHLDKQHEGTRWSSVFAPSSSSSDTDVPETLDPTELYMIRETLEKYTASLQDGKGGLGRGVPSLADAEMDVEVDSAVGRAVYQTWVAVDGTVPAWTAGLSDAPLNLLSTPLPGAIAEADASIVVKNHIDGLLYTLGLDENEVLRWTHSATYSALSFVLASKQDARFTHHAGARAVLVFESGALDRGGNLYIYRGTVGLRDMYAKQAILRIGGGAAGALLGVGAVQASAERRVVLCLCEGEVIVLREVL